MRTRKTFVLAALVLFILSSCDLLSSLLGPEAGVTVAERINAFEDDLNVDDRSVTFVETHFHPDVQSYDQLQADITTTTSPLRYTNGPFEIGEPTSVVASGSDQIATCSFSNPNATGQMVFTMRLDGNDYKILKLVVTIDGSTDEFVIQRFESRSE